MDSTTETTDTTQEVDSHDTEPAGATPEPGSTGESGGNAEAAKYRRKLRDTQAERDALAGRLQAMQRAEAERLAADTLAKPAALWAGGTQLADLLDDDGNIDPAKVTDAATDAADTLGLAAPVRYPANDTSATRRGDAPVPLSWSDVLKQ